MGSWVKPEPSLKQCPSLGIITCSCIINMAMITDMRSPDVIFGKAWEIFLLLIIQLTLERETSSKNMRGEKPPQNTAEFQPSPWKYNQSKNPAPRKGTRWVSSSILPSCHTLAFDQTTLLSTIPKRVLRKTKLKLIFGTTGMLSQGSRKRQEKQVFSDELWKEARQTSIRLPLPVAQPGRTSPLPKPQESSSLRSQETPTAGFGLQVGVWGVPPPQGEKSRWPQLPSLTPESWKHWNNNYLLSEEQSSWKTSLCICVSSKHLHSYQHTFLNSS